MEKIKAYLASFAGFSGQYCEIEMNQCDSAPCLNGAVCQSHVNSYDCFCPEGKLFKIIYFYYLWKFSKLPAVCKASSWQSSKPLLKFPFYESYSFVSEAFFASLSTKATNKTSMIINYRDRHICKCYFFQTKPRDFNKVWRSGENTNVQYMKSTENVINKLAKKIVDPDVLTCGFVTEHSKQMTMVIITTVIYLQCKDLLKLSQTKIMWFSLLLVCFCENAYRPVLSKAYEQMSGFKKKVVQGKTKML